MLEKECAAAGVRIVTGCEVRSVTAGFTIETVRGDRGRFAGDRDRRTLGPEDRRDAVRLHVARQFGLRIVECRPALVPFTFSREDRERYGGLEGVSAAVAAGAGGSEFREKLLFTHRGVSGPAILQASSYWQPGNAVEIDLLPDVDLAAQLRDRRAAGDRAEARTVAACHLPKRLADRWSEVHVASRPVTTLSDRQIEAIAESYHRWRFVPAGTEGYEKAEVTAGGVDTADLSSKTMEAKRTPGLYFVGEAVDVTGHLGGFNFQWAWASGYSAGQYV